MIPWPFRRDAGTDAAPRLALPPRRLPVDDLDRLTKREMHLRTSIEIRGGSQVSSAWEKSHRRLRLARRAERKPRRRVLTYIIVITMFNLQSIVIIHYHI